MIVDSASYLVEQSNPLPIGVFLGSEALLIGAEDENY